MDAFELTHMKRSFLVQLAEYNRLEKSIESPEQIDAMSDEEVDRLTDLLIQTFHDLNELHDRIEDARAERGDS